MMAAAIVLFALSLAGYRSPADIWRALTAAPEDGDWTAISIDGRPVEPERYRITLVQKKVLGGRDDCNDWSYDDQRDKPGERMIVSTLVACPENDSRREAYWAIANNSTVTLRPDDKLLISGQGHSALMVRCRWKLVRESSSPVGISEVMRCLPDE